MTEQEVIEYLRIQKPTGNQWYKEPTKKAFDIAIKALEKQIPKKPIIKTNLMTKHVSAHCSICDTDITYYSSEEHYCHKCGQAIKWE